MSNERGLRSAPVRQGLATEVCARLQVDLDALVDDMWEAIVGAVEPYARLPADHGDGRIRQVAEICLRAVAGRPYAGPRTEQKLRRIAASNADLGVPLEALSAALDKAFLVGAMRMQEAALTLSKPESPDGLLAVLWPRLMTAFQWVREVMTSGHQQRSEDRIREQAYREERWWNSVLDGGRAPDTPPLPSGPLLLLTVVYPRQPADQAGQRRRVRDLLQHLPKADVAPQRRYPVLHSAIVIPTAEGVNRALVLDRVSKGLSAAGLLGVAEYLEAAEEIRPAYQRVVPLLPALPLVSAQRSGLVDLGQLTLERLLTSVPLELHEEFLRETLGPILIQPPARSEPLLDTLVALARPGASASTIAESLNVLPRTVHHRLARVAELTGLDHREPCCLALLILGARLLTLRAGTLPPPGAPAWGCEPSAGGRVPLHHVR